MHTNSKLLFERYARPLITPKCVVLEIGPDAFPSTYQSMVGDPTVTWDTLDRFHDDRLSYTATSDYDFPVPDDAYDVVLSGQVIEHVPRIWVWIKEVARVCKPGGVVITISPTSWPYHEAPIDCWRTYPEGMKALYENAGLADVWCWWGSLETNRHRHVIPGRSAEWQPKWLRVAYRVLGRLGLPVEAAYDTITIGHKVRSPVEPRR
jgi:SAM-dependent methyltransferase